MRGSKRGGVQVWFSGGEGVKEGKRNEGKTRDKKRKEGIRGDSKQRMKSFGNE